MMLDAIDRQIINTLQRAFPICDRPYLEVAESLGIDEADLIKRLQHLLDNGVLTRFGPMFQIEKFGGAFTLAAMKVPETQFDSVTNIVNEFNEIAHNYQREHEFNMWFVIATESTKEIAEVIQRIETLTGLTVYNMPKQQEFYINLHFAA